MFGRYLPWKLHLVAQKERHTHIQKDMVTPWLNRPRGTYSVKMVPQTFNREALFLIEGGLVHIFMAFRCFYMLLGVLNKNLSSNNFFELVWPHLPGVLKIQKFLYNPKNENLPMWVFDSSNEAPECTDNNAKNCNSLWCTIAKEKLRKPLENDIFF